MRRYQLWILSTEEEEDEKRIYETNKRDTTHTHYNSPILLYLEYNVLNI